MGAPEVPPLCRETPVSRKANVGTVGKNGLTVHALHRSTIKFIIDYFKQFATSHGQQLDARLNDYKNISVTCYMIICV